MARHKERARILKWRGKYYLFWTDYTCSPEGTPRRTSCESLGAYNASRRKELLETY